MPELPEVETVCRALKKNIKSREVSQFKIFNRNLRWKIDSKINKCVHKKILLEIIRKGKYL